MRGTTVALPALLAPLKIRAPDPNPGVDRNATVGKREYRVQVELGDRGQIAAEGGEPVDEVDERSDDITALGARVIGSLVP